MSGVVVGVVLTLAISQVSGVIRRTSLERELWDTTIEASEYAFTIVLESSDEETTLVLYEDSSLKSADGKHYRLVQNGDRLPVPVGFLKSITEPARNEGPNGYTVVRLEDKKGNVITEGLGPHGNLRFSGHSVETAPIGSLETHGSESPTIHKFSFELVP